MTFCCDCYLISISCIVMGFSVIFNMTNLFPKRFQKCIHNFCKKNFWENCNYHWSISISDIPCLSKHRQRLTQRCLDGKSFVFNVFIPPRLFIITKFMVLFHGNTCNFQNRVLLTCMPQIRTPREADVLCSHFFIWRAFFSSDASSPYCLVPIFKSRMHGYLYLDTRFSSNRNSGCTS